MLCRDGAFAGDLAQHLFRGREEQRVVERGVAAWKGLAFGVEKPLIAVPTLDAMAQLGVGAQGMHLRQTVGSQGLFAPG